MIWPFKSRAEKEAEERAEHAYRLQRRQTEYNNRPEAKYQTRFRQAMMGAPAPIIEVFNDADELCNPPPNFNREITFNDLLLLGSMIKDGTFKDAVIASHGGDAAAMTFYSGLTTTFNAVMALLPTKGSGGNMMMGLREIDGAFIAKTLTDTLTGCDLAQPLVGPLVNNQTLFVNLVASRKQPKDPYQVTKLLLAGTPFARLPDLRIPF